MQLCMWTTGHKGPVMAPNFPMTVWGEGLTFALKTMLSSLSDAMSSCSSFRISDCVSCSSLRADCSCLRLSCIYSHQRDTIV